MSQTTQTRFSFRKSFGYVDFLGKENKDTKKDEIDKEKTKKLIEVNNKNLSNYILVAKDIISGKYGNGNERKSNLKLAGYDYRFAQEIVNILLK